MIDSNATLLLRPGTTAQHSTYTGSANEVTVDTDKKALVVHDGVTAGGFPAAKIADFAAPPAIGNTTPSTGAFTTLSATGTATFSSTVSVLDNNTLVKNSADQTKIAKFDASAISTATTQVFTLPNISATLAHLGGAAQAFAGAIELKNTFTLDDPSNNTKQAVFDLSGISVSTLRTYTLPNLSATLAHLGNAAQTFTGTCTFSNTFTVSAATATLGSSTSASTIGVGTGATSSGQTKTVNLGTSGASGSTTNLNLGSATSGALGTATFNSPTIAFSSLVTAININGTTTLSAASTTATLQYLGLGGATPDATNRLSMNTPAVLINNAGAGAQVKVNKNATGDTGSFLFQKGFSGRAEIGLIGDDDFHFKSSPDGASFYDVIVLSSSTGLVTLPFGQIKFPGTQNPSSDVNTLDDYEEGTWTPDLRLGGANTGITYLTNVGVYRKIGGFCYIALDFQLSNKGSATGNATIVGLPFASVYNGITPGVFGLWFNITGLTTTPLAFINGATSTITLRYANGASTSNMNDTYFANDTRMTITFGMAVA